MPSNKQTESQYGELKKKLKLPDFNDLDSEFEISDLEETNFLFRAIIRRIAEKLDFYTRMLEEVLQPDTSNLYAMHETRYFNEKEKNEMYSLYSELMDLNRHSIEVSLSHIDKEEAEFIERALETWKKLKNELLKYVKKMRTSWKEEVDIKEDVGYLG
ncbi:hypothetical protein HYS31_07010 [Candidatus Woesearchaeota archaeon]|nr:hypothetical protein [Candidatus Woesearchaeota archaeon]